MMTQRTTGQISSAPKTADLFTAEAILERLDGKDV